MAQNTPDLASYDIVLANISGGKDSQVMLARVVRMCREAGVSSGRGSPTARSPSASRPSKRPSGG